MSETEEFQEDAMSVSERLAAEALIVDVEGFEGPLDLLLTLSRTQKVDLRKISVLELSVQYLAFVERARHLRIELAADYLVMAAWLAFLKSRLLLPPDPTEEGPSGRGTGRPPCVPVGTPSGHARCRRQTDGTRPARAGFLCAWRSRRRDPRAPRNLYRDAFGPDARLCPYPHQG